MLRGHCDLSPLSCAHVGKTDNGDLATGHVDNMQIQQCRCNMAWMQMYLRASVWSGVVSECVNVTPREGWMRTQCQIRDDSQEWGIPSFHVQRVHHSAWAWAEGGGSRSCLLTVWWMILRDVGSTLNIHPLPSKNRNEVTDNMLCLLLWPLLFYWTLQDGQNCIGEHGILWAPIRTVLSSFPQL